MTAISRSPTTHHLRHGLASNFLPCEIVFATPRHGSNPRVIVFRSQARGEFITRIETRIPESIMLSLKGRAITAVIQIAELEGHAWSSSRVTLVEEKPIPSIGPRSKTKAPPPRGFRTFLYSS